VAEDSSELNTALKETGVLGQWVQVPGFCSSSFTPFPSPASSPYTHFSIFILARDSEKLKQTQKFYGVLNGHCELMPSAEYTDTAETAKVLFGF